MKRLTSILVKRKECRLLLPKYGPDVQVSESRKREFPGYYLEECTTTQKGNALATTSHGHGHVPAATEWAEDEKPVNLSISRLI